MPDWAHAARAALAHEPVALVTVLATEGSAPRGRGTRMVVTAGASHGSIGGGKLEHQAIDQARAILDHPPGSWRVQDYPLGPLLGQCCGGRVRLLVERLATADWAGTDVVTELGEVVVRHRLLPGKDRGPVATQMAGEEIAPDEKTLQRGPGFRRGAELDECLARGPLPNRFHEPDDAPRCPLLLFGAGHVGQAIARLLPGLPLDLAWFDSRPDFDRAGVMIQDEAALVACAAEAGEDTAVLILTHDHALDYHLTAAALRSSARFVGLIGSLTKRARFLKRLQADGIDTARLTCPIGLRGIPGKEPAVIAVAAVAQLLALGTPSCP